MVTSTAVGTASPHRPDEPEVISIEVVAVATDQAATLATSIHRLHRALAVLLPAATAWSITIVDHGSRDQTWRAGAVLARELPDVHVVRIPERLGRKELQRRWASSTASTVAFVTVQPGADFAALVVPLARRLTTAIAGSGTGVVPPPTPAAAARPIAGGFSRRSVLATFGGAGLAAVLAACGGSSDKTSSSSTAATSTTTASSASSAGTVAVDDEVTPTTITEGTVGTDATQASVPLATEMTEGPYYLDLDLVRSDIREDREGAPLALTLRVVESSTGQPVPDAAVDIWHCDAEGLYSGFVDASVQANGGSSAADSGTFLRGTQLADATGNVTFTTIYPGWYQGRTVHIHVKVHVDDREVHTGQLFFDDSFTDEVYTAAPYSSRGERTTRNDNDGIYRGGGAASTLDVSGSGDYAAQLALGIAA